MAEETYFERKKKIAETIVTLSASSDPADQRMAIELGEILRNMQEKYNPVPEVPVKEIVEEAPADTLGEPYIDRSLGQQAMDFVKEQTTPERAELLGMTLGTIPAWMSLQADALPGGRLGSAALRKLGGLLSPAAIGTGFHQASLALPWNEPYREKEAGWGTWSGTPFKPWDRGTGLKGSIESTLGWEAYGQAAPYAIKAPTDVIRAGVLGFKGAHDRATQKLAEYATLGLNPATGKAWVVPPAYSASSIGLVRAVGPAFLRMPGVRGGALKRYREAMTGARDFFYHKIQGMLPRTKALNVHEAGSRMLVGARQVATSSIKAIDDLYNAAYSSAKAVFGDAPVIDIRNVLNVINDIKGGGIRATVTKDGVTRPVRAKSPEGILNWINKELAHLDPRTSIEGMKDLKHLVQQEMDRLAPTPMMTRGQDGFRELSKINDALNGALKTFFNEAKGGVVPRPGGVWIDVPSDVAKLMGEKFTQARRAALQFQRLIATPAGQDIRTIIPSFFQRRYLTPVSGARFVELGANNIDEFYKIAFLDKSPAYLKHLEKLIGPKAYKIASQRWLNDVFDASMGAGGQALLNLNAFLRMTGIDTQPQVLRQILKGSGVTVEQIKSLGAVLRDFPMDDALQQMLVRRIGLAGTPMGGAHSIARMVPTMALAGGGAAAGGGAGIGLFTFLIGLGLTRRIGTVLSSPKLLTAIAEYGKLDRATLRTKAWRATRWSAALKLIRLVAEQFGDDPITKEEIATAVKAADKWTEPIQRHMSPYSLETGKRDRWFARSGPGADISDILY